MYVQWKIRVFDSASFTGSGEYRFFHGQDIQSSDIDLKMQEAEVIEFLVKNFRDFLLEICELPSSGFVSYHVVEPLTNRAAIPGDIDLLLYDKSRTNQAMAIEVKVLKKRQVMSNTNFVDNLHRMREAFKQAEGLVNLGFHSVFIMIVVLANTSIETKNNLATRAINTLSWKTIVDEYNKLRRNKKIGLIQIEIDQNTAKPIRESGLVQGFMYRKYKNTQSDKITELLGLR